MGNARGGLRGIDVGGAKVVANVDTVRIAWPPVGKANVRTPGVFVRRIDRCVRAAEGKEHHRHRGGESNCPFHGYGLR